MESRALPIRYLSGEANDEEVAALEAWLLQSPANALLLAECAVDEQNLSDALHELHGQIDSLPQGLEITRELFQALLPKGDLEPVDITEMVLAREQQRLEEALREEQRRAAIERQAAANQPPRVVVIPRAVAWLASAAVIGVLVWLGSIVMSSLQSNGPQTTDVWPFSEQVAVVSANSDAVWARPLSADAALRADEQLELISGIAEIKFKQGAVVLVEGPAVITPDGFNRVTLDSGRLFAEVPPEAVGFEVDTRFGMIRDFGTEFGVMVDPLAGLQTQVYKGEIGVMARDMNNKLGPMTKLQDHQAARVHVGQAGVYMDQSNESGYVRREEFDLLTADILSPVNQWKAHLYRLKRSGKLLANIHFMDGHLSVQRGLADQPFITKWVGGDIVPIKSENHGVHVMQLDGVARQGVSLLMPSHSGYDQLTLVAWARVEKFGKHKNVPLLHQYEPDVADSAPNWQLRLDRDAVVMHQQALVSNDTRNEIEVGEIWGQWHCFAVVMDARAGTVQHYLDGRWVGATELAVREPLKLDGLCIGSSGSSLGIQHRSLKGEIGTFTLLDTALDDQDMRHLYDASRQLFN